ncbi:MAG: alpha/beta fold hydrolase [Chloroflexales bacterium]|nr:alpha/beta fold hydrolase [Chloroflexales bacterium]
MAVYLPVFSSPEGEAAALATYQAVLHRWPVPYEQLTVPTSYGDTHVVASGQRGDPTVILLHASFAGAISWYHSAGALSAYYRVYAVDMVGEPNRSRPTCAIESLEQLTQWFAELTAGLGARHFDLVGSGYGGFAAAYFAMRLPERVRKLALIGPAATIQPIAPFYVNMIAPRAAYTHLPRLPGFERAMRRAAGWMLAGLPTDEAWAPFFQLALVHGAITTRLRPHVYSADELRHIRAPTMLLLGDHERSYSGGPGAAARAARLALPAARIERVPRAHLLAAIANPSHVNARLLWFLDSYSTRPDGTPMHTVEPPLLELAAY